LDRVKEHADDKHPRAREFSPHRAGAVPPPFELVFKRSQIAAVTQLFTVA
jgi:hypothetical protein